MVIPGKEYIYRLFSAIPGNLERLVSIVENLELHKFADCHNHCFSVASVSSVTLLFVKNPSKSPYL